MKNKKVSILNIDEDYIQSVSASCLNRKLTSGEYKEVVEVVWENLPFFVQEKIEQVIEFKNMLKMNKNAEKVFPHFKVFNRNVNAFRREFQLIGIFKTAECAREFTEADVVPFDEWKIIRVDKGNIEKEVYADPGDTF